MQNEDYDLDKILEEAREFKEEIDSFLQSLDVMICESRQSRRTFREKIFELLKESNTKGKTMLIITDTPIISNKKRTIKLSVTNVYKNF